MEGAGGEAAREPGPKHTLQPLLELIGSLCRGGGERQGARETGPNHTLQPLLELIGSLRRGEAT